MRGVIMIVDADPQENRELCFVFERNHFATIPAHSLAEMFAKMRMGLHHAVIFDLDSLPVENRFISKLCKENPGLCVIGISSRSFHPELEEAMRSHISACLSKPVKEDELVYWLQSTCRGEASSRASPGAEEVGD